MNQIARRPAGHRAYGKTTGEAKYTDLVRQTGTLNGFQGHG